MKKIVLPLLVGMAFLVYAFKGGEEYKTLSIGDKAPMVNHKMESTAEEQVSLSDLKGQNGTIVMFTCNTCPFVIAWEDRYAELYEMASENDMGMALINSNEAKRSGDDSMEEMMSHAEEKGYEEIPYLLDANSGLANAFGGKSTPHVFLFDKDWKLVYEGAIDDNYKSAKEAKSHYLKDAITNLSAGKKIDPNNTKALGCSIKRIKS